MKFSSLLKTSGLIVAAFSFVQCSSSTKSTTGTTPDSGTSGAGCQAYCDAIMTNCTGGQTTGSNQQYGTKENCMSVCTAFPVGTSSDQAGNTLGCRTYHANAAAGSTANAALHCPHAGPGGDGVCGDVCTSYCQIAEKFCIGANKIYTSSADCMATCNATTAGARFNISIQDGDARACLLYHSQEGSIDPTHCTDDLAKQTGDAGAGGSVTCH